MALVSRDYAFLVGQLRRGAYPDVPTALTNALQALDAVTAARQQLEAYAPTWAQLPGSGSTLNQRNAAQGLAAFTADLGARLAGGETLPDDLIDQAQAARVNDERAAAAETVVNLLEVSVVQSFDVAAEDAEPQLRAGLGEKLAELMARVQATATLLDNYDVEDAEQLVTAPTKVRTAYADLVGLGQEYDAIRSAQRALDRKDVVVEPNDEAVRRSGVTEIRDALTVWPEWRQTSFQRPRFPWPANPRARLLYVAAHDFWVPSIVQARHVWASAITEPIEAPVTAPTTTTPRIRESHYS